MRAARLPRDVREKAEDGVCPCVAFPPASGELRSFVALGTLLAAADRDSLRFFTPITQRIGCVGTSFHFFQVFRAYRRRISCVERYYFYSKQQRANPLNPLRDGCEKTKPFFG